MEKNPHEPLGENVIQVSSTLRISTEELNYISKMDNSNLYLQQIPRRQTICIICGKFLEATFAALP